MMGRGDVNVCDARTDRRGTGRGSEAGFTLVEALVAIVVLIFGLMAITNLMIVAASSNTAANQSTAAATTASQQMELLKAVPFTELAAGGSVTSDATVSGTDYFNEVTLPGVGTIHTRWEIAEPDGQTRFIRVRSEGIAKLVRSRSRAELTTFRTCTAVQRGCPTP
jgi:type II secretory pathway pseudopilin PulG